MKKVLIAVCLVLGIGAFYLLKGPVKNSSATSEGDITKIVPDNEAVSSSKKDSLRETIKNSRYKKEEVKTNLASSFPESCEDSLGQLRMMTQEEYFEIMKSKEKFYEAFNEECRTEIVSSKAIKELAKNTMCNVFDAKFDFKDENIYGPCSSFIFALKAYSIADNTRGVDVNKMTSQELAANFVKMFFSTEEITKENFQKNLEIIDTLYEMHSDDPNVVEAYLGYIMVAKHAMGDKTASERIDRILTNPTGDSFKVDRLGVIKSVLENDLNGAKTKLDRLNEMYQGEPELSYYYAAYHWKNGNKSMAKKYLDKAIKLGVNGCSYCTPGMYKQVRKAMVTFPPYFIPLLISV